MLSHVVIFWTHPDNPAAADELLAGIEHYLRPIPGALFFHAGRMAGSHRPVVDQSYQVALNIIFPSREVEKVYQDHPQHIEFIEKVFKKACLKATVYDFIS